MPTPWEDDPADAPKLAANVTKVLTGIAGDADKRKPPTVAMAQQWHRDLYDEIARPHDYYAGEIRDSDQKFPDLIGYEVQVGGVLGVPSAQVSQALARFEAGAQTAAPGSTR